MPEDLKDVGYHDLDIVTMSEHSEDVRAAGRRLEVFLDRLCWKATSENDSAAEYLLDERYLSSLTPEDEDLRAALLRLTADVSPEVRSKSPAWRRIEAVLRDLGWRSDI